MKTIGILGGGQLGGMLCESLMKLGARVMFYDPDPHSPSFFRSPYHYQGEWNDFNKLKEFFSKCDVVTYEFENVSTELLNSLVQETSTPLIPSAHALTTTQNRIYEKNFLKENQFPVCAFFEIKNYEYISLTTKHLSFPFILKTATGGYDGKGQWFIADHNDLNKFANQFTKDNFVPLIAEEKIDIECEASCIVARDFNGNTVCFPIFDNVHAHHILKHTTVPSQLPDSVQNELKNIAIKAAEKLNVVGLLTTEFFITKQKSNYTHQNSVNGFYVYVNEFAPRPHNSGHITRNACNLSQFDAHARVLLNLPLHQPKLHPGYYCMGNLLGDCWISQGNKSELNLSSWQHQPEIIDVILYGKLEAKTNRKMGHFVSYSQNNGEHILAAERFEKGLNEKSS
ncbi:5-(carboxyamino)imidazole ribonucleotide synthase [Silvanigrella aquatica]|uniref:N5-carboxyaminoimidazole ribonucleotide synthase n=1 Tax=Silvanigrella aquatica TaxID=1915309 RepID=A0A1L4CZL0_9BACT|nr:ATP-grasp domain-containing protein [Silvanigrella aquatica]APJ03394.1 hypothetical protein AXG55_05530 [Silvanigrella aquatica]